MSTRVSADYLIIGSGIAGLRAAVTLAASGRVLMLTKSDPSAGSTGYAQGGIAAVTFASMGAPWIEQRLGRARPGGLHAHELLWLRHQRYPFVRRNRLPLGAVVLEGHSGPMRVLDIAAGHGLMDQKLQW